MFIDIHVHAFRLPNYPRTGGPFATTSQLLEYYDKTGIEQAVVLPVVNAECNYGVQFSEDIIEIARNNPRFIPFCNIDPRALTNSYTAREIEKWNLKL